MAFDFKAVQAALVTSFDYEVIHPITKEPTGWFVELATAAHGTAQHRVRLVLDRMAKRKGSTVSQDEQDGVDLIAARIIGWRGLEEDGQPVAYTPEAAAKIISGAGAFWLRNQLVEAMGDAERPFMAKTPGAS